MYFPFRGPMWFVAGANTFHLGSMFSIAGLGAIIVGLAGYQMDRIRAWLDPWKYESTIGSGSWVAALPG